jgi:membrane protein implicated in regulation of membrane protease activity
MDAPREGDQGAKMILSSAGKNSAFGSLLLLWLAVHAVILGLILGLKFLTVKTLALLFLADTVLWLLSGKRRTPSLPAPPGMI